MNRSQGEIKIPQYKTRIFKASFTIKSYELNDLEDSHFTHRISNIEYIRKLPKGSKLPRGSKNRRAFVLWDELFSYGGCGTRISTILKNRQTYKKDISKSIEEIQKLEDELFLSILTKLD